MVSSSSSSKKQTLNSSSNKKKKNKNHVALDHSSHTPTFLSYLCIFLGLGWLPIFPLIYLFRHLLWNYFKPFLILFCLISLVSLLYPIDHQYQPQFLINFGTWMTRTCTAYFSFKVEFENLNLIQNLGPSIFAVEPHGVLPVTLYWGTLNLLSSHKFLCCLSSSILSIPVMKHFLTWSGAISAEKKNLIKYLNNGYSLSICPGGVQEVKYLNNSNEIILFLNQRIGLTKLCLEQGCALVPVATFGLHKIYNYYLFAEADRPTSHAGPGSKSKSAKSSPSNWFSDVLLAVGRKLGFLPMIFFGLWNIPFAQPKPSPLTIVIGKPIPMPKIEKPSAEEIAKYHEVFLREMRRVFEDNKAEHGMGEFTIRIE
jgi:diacylglycerol O-acyltransferase 2, plant